MSNIQFGTEKPWLKPHKPSTSSTISAISNLCWECDDLWPCPHERLRTALAALGEQQ